MSDWDDYLAAARRLDTVRREAASLAVAGTDPVGAAWEELATVRQRLDRQRTLLLALAGAPGPVLPTGASNGAEPGSGAEAGDRTEAGAGDRTEAGAGDRAGGRTEAGDRAEAGAGGRTEAGHRAGAGDRAGAGGVPDGYGLAGSAFDAGAAGDVPVPEPGDSPVARSTATGDADGGTATGDAEGMELPCLRALRAASAHLDAVDAILSGLGRPGQAGNRPPVRRNALVYGSFAVVVLAVQVALFGTLKDTVASMVATAAGAVLPLVGFGLSWLLIGLIFGGRGRRTGVGDPFAATSRAPRAASGRIRRLPALLRLAGRRVLRGRSGDGWSGDGRSGDGRSGDGRYAGSGDVPHASPDVPSLDRTPRVETGDRGSGRVDRTPLLGAAISLAPVVVLCAGLGTAALLR